MHPGCIQGAFGCRQKDESGVAHPTHTTEPQVPGLENFGQGVVVGAPLSSRRVASPKFGHGRVHPTTNFPRDTPASRRVPGDVQLWWWGCVLLFHLFWRRRMTQKWCCTSPAGRRVGGAPPAATRFASPNLGHRCCTPTTKFPRDTPASRRVPGGVQLW